MKLNFWQWLGVVLLVVGIAWYVLDRPHAPAPAPDPSPTTQAH
jgi:drug/metabolite transporter (DMT)-like permease